MIIENGNDIDLRDLDDREPDEPEDESLSLEQIEQLYTAYQHGIGSEFRAAILLRDAVPQLITELRNWRSLEREPQHGVQHGGEWIVYDDAESAKEGAELRGGTAGIRDVYVTSRRTRRHLRTTHLRGPYQRRLVPPP
jgi:hypothetical protein